MKTIVMNEKLYDYVSQQCDLPSPVLDELAKETAKLKDSVMQISRDQGAFMHMITTLIGAKKAIEIGCYTGYSAICVASALGSEGKLISFDINEEIVSFAKRFFAKADLEDRIEVRVGDAKTNLEKLKNEASAGSFDMAFIDADKESLETYFEQCLHLVRKNGLIIVDNVLWSGKVIDPSDKNPPTEALRKFNQQILGDRRVERCMLHIADGLYLLRKC